MKEEGKEGKPIGKKAVKLYEQAGAEEKRDRGREEEEDIKKTGR